MATSIGDCASAIPFHLRPPASLRLPGGSRRHGCSGDVAPDAEGCGAGSTVIIGARAMTTKLEAVVDPAVG
jgi:hypothetical protein